MIYILIAPREPVLLRPGVNQLRWRLRNGPGTLDRNHVGKLKSNQIY